MAKAPVPLDFYAGLIRDQERQREADPVGEALARMRSEEVRRNIVDSPAPDEAAKVNRVARETGDQHALIEDRLPDYEKVMSAQRFSDIASRYSVLGQYFSDNPRAAIAAQDDHRSLGILGGTISRISAPDRVVPSLSTIAQGIWASIRGGARQANLSTQMMLGDLFKTPDWVVGGKAYDEGLKREFVQAQDNIDQQQPQFETRTGSAIYGGVASLAQMTPGIVASVVLRNPTPAVVLAGAQSGLPAYGKYRSRGATAGQAALGASIEGGAEAIGEILPMGVIASKFGKTGTGKFVSEFLLKEMLGEQATTLIQDAADTAIANPDKSWDDYWAERPGRAYDTAVGVLVAGGALGGVNYGARVLASRQGKAQVDTLTGFEKAAAESKLRQRDPEGYSEMIGKVAEQAGVESVFVPAEAVREYMQSDSYDPYSDPLEAYRDVVDEAYETGGDVVLPSDFALGTLPGTPAWGALREDMRLSSGGMSPREAQTFEEAMADVVAEIETEMARDNAEQDAAIDAQGKLLKSVQDKLMNAGFTPYTAQQQATLIVQRIATRAARMGQELTGNEFTTEVRQVLPPELAAARDADATDLVINALRKGRDPASQSGPSLLEWISARGGVNDTGGDLASMGLDQWHKGKPGKRKLVRKFDPTMALGGVSGAGDYGVDTTLRAAIEAGYFPELANVANEGGVDTLDTQVLLDAMSAELAGVKRYAADARVDAYRAAAEELDQLLMERGLDPAGMSDAELRAAIAGLDREGSAEGAFEQAPAENSEAFKRWAGTDAPVIEPDEIADFDFSGPGPFVMRVFHGTTHQFEAFDASIRGNMEGQFGAVNYFTSSEVDASANYAGEGPDLTSRIEKRAEQLAPEIEDRFAEEGRNEVLQQFYKETGLLRFVSAKVADMDDGDAAFDAARTLAKRELAGGTQQTLEIYVRTEKPFVVGTDESPWIEFTDFDALERQAIERVAEDEGIEVSEVEANRDDYQDAIDDARWEIEADTPNALFEAVQRVADRYELDAQEVYGQISDAVDSEGTKHNRLEDILRQTEALTYAENPETGDLIGFHVLGEIIRELGFDSIVMKNADVRFKNMKMDKGTVHVHVFDEHRTNIKSVQNTGAFDRNDPRILFQSPREYYQAAYHGSPHIFDKFSLDAIGTGEGAQAYGYGLYFAGRRDIAQFYRDNLSNRGGVPSSLAGVMPSSPDEGLSDATWVSAKKLSELLVADTGIAQPFSSLDVEAQRRVLAVMIGLLEDRKVLDAVVGLVPVDVVNMLDGAERSTERLLNAPTVLVHLLPFDPNDLVSSGVQAVDVLAPAVALAAAKVHTGLARFDAAPSDFTAALGAGNHDALLELYRKIPQPSEFVKGRLYQVEIPNDDEYLLWDKPLSEQPEKVKEGVAQAFKDAGYDEDGVTMRTRRGDVEGFDVTGQEFYEWLSEHLRRGGEQPGEKNSRRADRAASLALRNAGIAGIKYLDGGSRSQGDGSFNYVVFDDSRVSIQAYEQSFADGPRGRIRFEQAPVIELFQSRNLSTLVHELGHQFLEELRFDAESDTAPEQMRKDWQTLQDWWAANNVPMTDGVIPVEAHELTARGFERYLMEGNAPSSALAKVFETIKGWMLSIYKKVEALRSPITPEVREVFARMLATDEEIEAARERQALMPLFKDAAAIGMTGPEFQAYQEQFTEARVDAQSEVLAKAMREVKARVTKEYRDQRAIVEADVTESVDQRPLFRALRNLKSMPVRKGWLEDNMGLDVFDLMPKRVPPLWSDKGSHPDAVAEMSGYQTGRQMIEALIGAEMAHRQAVEGGDKRTLRERTIQSEVDAIMRERHGDPLTDGTIEREALAAVNNEKQGEVLASELRILSRKTGQRPTPYRIARQWARGKVRQGIYATEASASAIQRHARAVAKHGGEAEKAMIAGKFDEAFAAKQKQMLSSALLAEAKAANDEVEAARKYLDRIASRRTMQGVDQEYLERAHELLEDVDLKRRSQRSLDRKDSFEAWAQAQRDKGEEVVTPDRFNYAGKNWSRLSTEEIIGLHDAVKSVMHLGRRKQTMLDNKAQREFDDWKAEALAVMEETPGRSISADLSEERSTIRGALAMGLKVENLARELDNDKPGIWTRLLVDRATEVENYRAEMRRRVLEPIAERYNAMSRKDRDRLAERVTLPEIPFRSADLGDPRNGEPRTLARWEIVGMALNMGTESNFDKLARGYGVAPAVIEEVVNRELTEQDWQFVQAIWDALETLWPDIAKVEREMSGVEPERVETREVQTRFGPLRGGYYPVVYDPAQSQVGEDNEAKAVDDLFGMTSGVATSKGHTKARTGFAAPILLSPEVVLFQHIEKVVTRSAYAPWVRDVLKVMRDRTVRAAFDRKMGAEYREMIEPWLRRQVRSGMTNERGTRWANAFLRQARVNMTVVSMGLRWSTGVAQTIGLANSAGRIGVNYLRKGMTRVLSNPREAAAFVFERSPEMEMRNQEMNRDTIEAFQSMRAVRTGRKGVLAEADRRMSQIQAFAFWHIGMIDRYVVSMPTWLGAYEKGLTEGMSDKEASAYADSMVRLSQGSGREKDLAAIQSPDSEAMRFFTMFYTPFNVLLNAQWETGRAVKRGDWRKVVAMSFWFMIATPLLDAMLAGDDPDDDDEYALSKWLARNIASYQLAGIPIIRDVSNFAERKAMGEFATFNPGPIARIFDVTSATGKDAWDVTFGDGEASDRWLRNAIETPGYFLGLPTGQVGATSQFIWDVSEGNVRPDGFWEWYEGLTRGRIKEEK